MSVDLKLSQVISGLRESLHSIDIRAAVRKSDSGWQRVLTGIRMSARPVEAVSERYATLEARFGKRGVELFRVLLQVLPSTALEEILSRLAQGKITVEGEPIQLSEKLLLDKLQGRVERHHSVIRPWGEGAWPGILCSSGQGSTVFGQPEVVAAVRGGMGFTSVEDLVGSFLEVKAVNTPSFDLFLYVEMPSRIKGVQVVGSTVEVQVLAEKNLQPLRLFLSRKDSQGVELFEHQELALETVGNEGPYALMRSKARLDSVYDDHLLSCVLSHPSLPVLDEVRERVKGLMPAPERNPLLECLKKFWDMDLIYQQVERPYESQTRKLAEKPQDAFQKSIARLLNLLGFQAIDLERTDKLRHPETGVERATIDILAYHQSRKVLLLGACTISPAKGEDVERLLHTTAILRRMLSYESAVNLIPVLFTGHEHESPFEDQGAKEGFRVLGAKDLLVLRMLLEKGEEERFLHFLESPFGGKLREKSEWEL